MSIRKATVNDEPAIRELLKQLDYPVSKGFLSDKIKILINNEDAELLVYEKESSVVAFISLHFIPQLAREGDYLRISYFAVEQKIRSNGIGREIEEYCTQLAKEKKCDRIELHTQSRRLLAQKFYTRQGYIEDPKYLIKKL